MWALTEKKAEEIKEHEVDELVEFAYQLDYEKFIEDFEVRQALAVLKERVTELKKDEKWKENFANEWNQANTNEQKEDTKEIPKEEQKEEPKEDKLEIQSVKSGSKNIFDVI